MGIEPIIRDGFRNDWRSAPFGARSSVVQKWAEYLCCSKKTLYRQLDTGRNREKGQYQIPEIEDYVRIVFQIKKKPPEALGEITTEQAIRIAIENGLIPEGMKNRSSTFDRIGRDMRLNKKTRRIQRYQAQRPNELHHVDASSSRCFYVKEALPDGDYVLSLHLPHKYYKNKPVPVERLRPWVYGLTDDNSGYHVAKYVVAHGETAVDNLSFLSWAWSKNEDKELFGLPDSLKGDLGPMMRGSEAKDFFKRLNVRIDPSIPGQKEAHGKIERPWRTTWQRFEKPFFVTSDWKKSEILLSEVNQQFFNYLRELNERSHRFEKGVSRLEAWKGINLHGGAVAMPEKALATIARRSERLVKTDGTFSIDGRIYEVKGLFDSWVYVYEGVFDDKVMVEDKRTGEKYECEDFKPNPVGVYTGHHETPHQKTVKEAQNLEVRNTLYETSKDPGNVAQFPTRIKETRVVENPLAVDDAYSSIDQAMMEFSADCIRRGVSVPTGRVREEYKKMIEKHGLSRQYIKDLAYECQLATDELKNEGRLANG
jgi:hypothetical protein